MPSHHNPAHTLSNNPTLERPLLYVTPSPDESLVQQLAVANWKAEVALRIHRPADYQAGEAFKVALMDLSPELPTFQELREWFQIGGPHTKWIALTSKTDLKNASIQSLIRRGFYDFQTLPTHVDRLVVTLGRAYGMAALEQSRGDPLREDAPDYGIIGDSEPIQGLKRAISKVGRTAAPVLILGESGTGKELTAKAIHAASRRRDGPFIPVNCGSIPPTLIQSELFGYEKGAFTGAAKRQIGKIEAASGGTIFLDEIGDLSLDLQVNLLRFLEERRIQRVGGTIETEVDVRVIAATHANMWHAVQAGQFREDLYYRLNVLRIEVPPLRTREGDIEKLAEHFFEQFSPEKQPYIRGFSNRAITAMRQYRWPGNVREMINLIRHALVMSEGTLVTPEDLGLRESFAVDSELNLEAARNVAEINTIALALSRSRNNLSEAARLLGVTRGTLYRLMDKHGIAAKAGVKSRDSNITSLRRH